MSEQPMMRRSAAIAVLLLLSLALPGCEDSGLIADPEGEIRVTASPSTVIIDEALGQTEGSATITATVFDASGYGQAGVAVTFSTSGGLLDSAASGTSVPVETNQNGVAVDRLTVGLADPTEIEVSAASGAQVGTVTVRKTVSSGNVPPTADVVASPSTKQVKGRPVTFSGVGSSDPDGQITCYQWTVDSTLNANDEVVQGPSTSLLTRTYTTEQFLTVTLRVSDDPDAATFCSPSGPPASASLFSPDIDFVSGYEIACAVTAPIARGGNDQNVSAGGASVTVTLDGSASTAGDAAIASYSWDCANGTPAQSAVTASCTYTNSTSQAITYTAELRVTDVCGLTSTDRVNIVVQP